MKWAWRIGRYAGIDVYIHATFLLLVAWVYFENQQSGGTLNSFLSSLGFLLTVFAIVVLHEFGHALAARRYGIPTRDITLLPIGGVARLERMPEDPWQEMVVALAGPAVNVAIAILLTLVLTPAALLGSLREMHFLGGSFLMKVLVANIVLILFNLIPAFPMDGGRVLRAALTLVTGDPVRATWFAGRIGQVLAVGLFFAGAFWLRSPFLVFIAVFVWFGAEGEARFVEAKAALSRMTVDRLMTTRFQTLSPDDSLASVVAQILAGFQHDFPVVEGGEVVGLLTRDDLITALKQRGDDAPVSVVMRHTFVTAHPSEPVDSAFARLRPGQPATVPVIYAGHLVGIVTAESVNEYLAIRGNVPRAVPPRLDAR